MFLDIQTSILLDVLGEFHNQICVMRYGICTKHVV